MLTSAAVNDNAMEYDIGLEGFFVKIRGASKGDNIVISKERVIRTLNGLLSSCICSRCLAFRVFVLPKLFFLPVWCLVFSSTALGKTFVFGVSSELAIFAFRPLFLIL